MARILLTAGPTRAYIDDVRYLTNDLRDRFGLAGVPLRISLRGGDNPYHDKTERR